MCLYLASLASLTICMQVFENYVKDATAKLSRKVEDLEDVRFVMAMLKEVRYYDCPVTNRKWICYTDSSADSCSSTQHNPIQPEKRMDKAWT